MKYCDNLEELLSLVNREYTYAILRVFPGENNAKYVRKSRGVYTIVTKGHRYTISENTYNKVEPYLFVDGGNNERNTF